MIKNIISFIDDENDALNAIGANSEELSAAAARAQIILYEMRRELGEEYTIEFLHSDTIYQIIAANLDELNFRELFLLLYLMVGATPITEEFVKIAYEIPEGSKINYKDFYERVLAKGIMQLEKLLQEMFIEIILGRDEYTVIVEKLEVDETETETEEIKNKSEEDERIEFIFKISSEFYNRINKEYFKYKEFDMDVMKKIARELYKPEYDEIVKDIIEEINSELGSKVIKNQEDAFDRFLALLLFIITMSLKGDK